MSYSYNVINLLSKQITDNCRVFIPLYTGAKFMKIDDETQDL